ncbi:hypothetical protein HBNXHx_1702 [Haloferax volcanii]|nr:hypothetical protein HBNXHx_1702 [Haloferax alexandrinus]
MSGDAIARVVFRGRRPRHRRPVRVRPQGRRVAFSPLEPLIRRTKHT